jgi:MFS family permease
MKIQLGNGKGKKDNSLALLHGEAATSAVENAGCAYQSPSVIDAGASAQGVALLSALTNLVLSILLIKVPSLVEGRQSSIKRTTIVIATVSTLTWLPLVFVVFFLTHASPLLLIALWTMNLVPTTLVYPLRDNWLASLIPAERMGRYLSWRSVISGVCYLATFYMMGVILHITSGFESSSHAFVLAIAFLASAITLVLYYGVRPVTTVTAAEKPSLTFFNFLKETRKNHLGTFIIFVSSYNFSVNLAGPLYASHMLTDLRFNYITYTTIVSVEYIARILSMTVWGRLVDKTGSLKILSEVSYIIPLVPILWLFSSNYLYLVGVQLLSGVAWAAFDLSVQTFIYKATVPAQRLRYLAYYRSLTSFSIALGALTGALLLNYVFSIFGSPILAVFLISGVLRLIVAVVILPKLTLRGIPNAVIHPELAVELAAVPVQERAGLYYYPELGKRFARAASSGSKVIGKAFSTIGISKNGLFYKPAKWIAYQNSTGVQSKQTTTQSTNLNTRENFLHKPGKWIEYPTGINAKQVPVENNYIVQPVRDGLFYHKEGWVKFQEKLQQGNIPDNSRHDEERRGLFHDSRRWAEYVKQTLALNATTIRTTGEGMALRQAVFYHPEVWEKYKKGTTTVKYVNASQPISRKALLYHPDEWQKHFVKPEQNKIRRNAMQYRPTSRLRILAATT